MRAIDWTTWDAAREEPEEYPEGGEPEGYILSRPHDAALAAELGSFWELVPDLVETVQGNQSSFRVDVYGGQHLVRAALSGGYNFVLEHPKDVLLAVAAAFLMS